MKKIPLEGGCAIIILATSFAATLIGSTQSISKLKGKRIRQGNVNPCWA